MIATLLKTIAYGLLFGCVFFICSIGLTVFLEDRVAPADLKLYSQKEAYILENAHQYDLVFIGSSRTYRLIDVDAMEAAFRARGCNYRVFNYGVPNLTYEESLRLQGTLAMANSGQLIHIAIEEPFRANHEPMRITSDRVRAFSDFENSVLRLRNILSFEEGWPKKIVRMGVNALSMAYHYTGLGLGSQFIFADAYAAQDAQDAEFEGTDTDFASTGGYMSLDSQAEINPLIQRRNDRLNSKKEQIIADFKAAVQTPPEPIGKPKRRAAMMKDMLHAWNKMGVQSWFYVPPLLNRMRQDLALSQEMEDRGFQTLNFNDPSKHPNLWDFDLWFDEYHLNAEGAHLLSREIATQICRDDKGARR